MELVTNDKLLQELSKRNISFTAGSGKSMFTEENTIKDCSYRTLIENINGLKPKSSKVCLFLTDKKLGLTCFFDELNAIVFSYSTILRPSRKKDIVINNMILLAYTIDGKNWNGSDIFWIVGKHDIPFTVSGDFVNNEIKDSNKARTIIRRASKLKGERSDILSFLERSLK